MLSRNAVSDSILIKVFALIGWIAWLQVAVSMVVETVAWARGFAAPRLHFGGAIQPAVCKLVASAALLISSTHLSNGVAPSLPVRPPAHAVVEGPDVAPVHTAVMTRAETPPQVATGTARMPTPTKTYTVLRYDTLWGLRGSTSVIPSGGDSCSNSIAAYDNPTDARSRIRSS